MIVSIVKIDGDKIVDWTTFHDEFNRIFGFHESYKNDIKNGSCCSN